MTRMAIYLEFYSQTKPMIEQRLADVMIIKQLSSCKLALCLLVCSHTCPAGSACARIRRYMVMESYNLGKKG